MPVDVTRPLCVDLDGTLLATDTLAESLLRAIKRDFRTILLLPWWLLGGKAHLKRQVASHALLNPEDLPCREEVLEFLMRQREAGRRIILVTAADDSVARAVASRFGCFDEVLASNGSINVKGKTKRRLLVDRFGEGGFDYAGDAPADLEVWQSAGEAIVVSDSPSLLRRLHQRKIRVGRRFSGHQRRLRTYLQAIRVHQWVKNVLVLVPLFLSHNAADLRLAQAALLAAMAFCFCASAIYVINDLMDLSSDRRHHAKRLRPFAAGRLPLSDAAWLVLLLLAGGLAAAWTLPKSFLLLLFIYCVASLLYSWRLKALILIDALVLAQLYALRVWAGGEATGVVVSPWLWSFSIFFFFSLGLAKRVTELRNLRLSQAVPAHGRGYVTDDLEALSTLGGASGYIAVLVTVLYVNSADVQLLYSRPQVLYLLAPILLYWISRLWLLVHRGEVQEDPVLFALTDRASRVAGGCLLAILLMAL